MFGQSGRKKPGGGERRQTCRYATPEARLMIGWWRDGRFHSEPARLLDLSAGGAGVVTTDHPPADRVWLYLGDAPEGQDGWTEAETVGTDPEPGGGYRLRLRFPD